MTILDLIRICPFQDVENELNAHYDDINIKKTRKLYSDLRSKIIENVIDEKWYLCITARRMQEDGADPAVEEFDEKDESIYFDVSAYRKGDDMLYSIASLPHEDFLQYIIEDKTLRKYAPKAILAHALWELTYYGYKDKRRI